MNSIERVEALARKDERVRNLIRELLLEVEQSQTPQVDAQKVKDKLTEILNEKAVL